MRATPLADHQVVGRDPDSASLRRSWPPTTDWACRGGRRSYRTGCPAPGGYQTCPVHRPPNRPSPVVRASCPPAATSSTIPQPGAGIGFHVTGAVLVLSYRIGLPAQRRSGSVRVTAVVEEPRASCRSRHVSRIEELRPRTARKNFFSGRFLTPRGWWQAIRSPLSAPTNPPQPPSWLRLRSDLGDHKAELQRIKPASGSSPKATTGRSPATAAPVERSCQRRRNRDAPFAGPLRGAARRPGENHPISRASRPDGSYSGGEN